MADKNDDALLDKQELQEFPEEFAYYLIDRHYALTDLNKDNRLSFNELSKRTKTEYNYRYNLERKQLRELSQRYPGLETADLAFLKSRPELVEQLFSNFTWMVEHASLAASLYHDANWTRLHPQTLIALHKNLRWMTANPAKARDLYSNRDMTRRLPELLGWRADHKAFIRRLPTPDRFYGLGFLPAGAGIEVNR